MTAQLIVQRPDAIHVWTDGVGYQGDGRVSHILRKIHYLDTGAGAVFGRGCWDLFTAVADHANRAGWSFDQTVQNTAGLVPGLVAEIERDVGPFDMAEICLAGWSDSRRQLEVWLLPTHDLHEINGIPRGQMSPLPPFYAAPGPPEDYLAAIGWMPSDPEVYVWDHVRDKMLSDDFDPRRDGLAFMEGQRLTPTEAGDQGQPGQYVVGGFCLWTEITRNGCRDDLLRIWPDRIGELIRPDLDARH